jgi:hypothetical protein
MSCGSMPTEEIFAWSKGQKGRQMLKFDSRKSIEGLVKRIAKITPVVSRKIRKNIYITLKLNYIEDQKIKN